RSNPWCAMPTAIRLMPAHESSHVRRAWSARSYESMEHPAKPSAATRSGPRWSSTRYCSENRSVNTWNHGQLVNSRRRSIFNAARVSAALLLPRSLGSVRIHRVCGTEPKRRDDGLIHDDLPRPLGHQPKVTGVVPHGPPDAVHLERGPDVGNPAHPVAGGRDTPIDAKLITDYANIPLLRPGGNLLNLCPNARATPLLISITGHEQLGHVIGQHIGHRGDVVRIRGIRDSTEMAPERPAPSGALMREYVRQVEVEVVDDIGVVDRLETEQFLDARPPMPTDDRRVPWCRLSDACEQLGLDSAPSIAVLELRLVQDLERDPFAGQSGEPAGEVAPEIREAVDLAIVSRQRLLEVRGRMHIDHDC